jgi:hypothetical protein
MSIQTSPQHERTERACGCLKLDFILGGVSCLECISAGSSPYSIEMQLLPLRHREGYILRLEGKRSMCSCGQAIFVNLAFLRQWLVGGVGNAVRSWASVAFVVFCDILEQSGCLWELVCVDCQVSSVGGDYICLPIVANIRFRRLPSWEKASCMRAYCPLEAMASDASSATKRGRWWSEL